VGKIAFAFKNAFSGLLKIIAGRMFRIGAAFGAAAIAISLYFPSSVFDRLVVITFTFLVLVFEGFNSTLEKLLDLISPEYNEKVGVVKDMLAGTVLIGAIGAVIVGILILIRVLQLT